MKCRTSMTDPSYLDRCVFEHPPGVHIEKPGPLDPDFLSEGMMPHVQTEPFPRIRRFRGQDLEKIREIESSAFPKTAYSEETLLTFFRMMPETFLLLETDQDVAGYILFDAAGHVYSMAVKPAYRRRGYGRSMLEHARKHVKKSLWLEVRSKNEGAIRFYRNAGMKLLDRIPNYYGTDDALIMVLDGEKP